MKVKRTKVSKISGLTAPCFDSCEQRKRIDSICPPCDADSLYEELREQGVITVIGTCLDAHLYVFTKGEVTDKQRELLAECDPHNLVQAIIRYAMLHKRSVLVTPCMLHNLLCRSAYDANLSKLI